MSNFATTAIAPVPDTSPSEVWQFSLDNLHLDELKAAKRRIDAAIYLFQISSRLMAENIAGREAARQTTAPVPLPPLEFARTVSSQFDIGAPYVRVEPDRRSKLPAKMNVPMYPYLLLPHGVLALPVPRDKDEQEKLAELSRADRISYRKPEEKAAHGGFPPTAKVYNKRGNKSRKATSPATAPAANGVSGYGPGASLGADARPAKRRRTEFEDDDGEDVYMEQDGAGSSSLPPALSDSFHHPHRRYDYKALSPEELEKEKEEYQRSHYSASFLLQWPLPADYQPPTSSTPSPLPHPPPVTHGQHTSQQQAHYPQQPVQPPQPAYQLTIEEEAHQLIQAARAREALQTRQLPNPYGTTTMPSAEGMRTASSGTMRYIPSDDDEFVDYVPEAPAQPAVPTASQPQLVIPTAPAAGWEDFVEFDPSPAFTNPTHGPDSSGALSHQAQTHGASPSFSALSGVSPGVSGVSGVSPGPSGVPGVSSSVSISGPSTTLHPDAFTPALTHVPTPVTAALTTPAEYPAAAAGEYPVMDPQAFAQGPLTNGYEYQDQEFAGMQFSQEAGYAHEGEFIPEGEYTHGGAYADEGEYTDQGEYTHDGAHTHQTEYPHDGTYANDSYMAENAAGEPEHQEAPAAAEDLWNPAANPEVAASLAANGISYAAMMQLVELGRAYYAPNPPPDPRAIGPSVIGPVRPRTPGGSSPNYTAHLADEELTTDNFFGFLSVFDLMTRASRAEMLRIQELQARRWAAAAGDGTRGEAGEQVADDGGEEDAEGEDDEGVAGHMTQV